MKQLKTLITLTIAHGNLYIYNTMPNFITLKLHFKWITLKLLYFTEDHVAIKQKNVIALYHGNHRLNTCRVKRIVKLKVKEYRSKNNYGKRNTYVTSITRWFNTLTVLLCVHSLEIYFFPSWQHSHVSADAARRPIGSAVDTGRICRPCTCIKIYGAVQCASKLRSYNIKLCY